jgi:hypothetical protein
MCCIIYLKIQIKYYELRPMGSYEKKIHLRKGMGIKLRLRHVISNLIMFLKNHFIKE